jgi:phosphate transport system ATP-binding protein
MPAGTVTALIGPSGCGKSTFLRILNRMHEPIPSASLAGEVLLSSSDVYASTWKLTDARKAIGMVFQKPNPFPAMSIYENVTAGLKLTGTRLSRSDRDTLVEETLTRPASGARSATASANPAAPSPAASSNACASPAPWPSAPGCC